VEDGADALNVSCRRDGGKGGKAKSKGGDRWSYYHPQKRGHFKRDCTMVIMHMLLKAHRSMRVISMERH
jgi:hypothetical protein